MSTNLQYKAKLEAKQHQEQHDVHESVEVEVQSQLGVISVIGIIAIVLGILAAIVTLILLVIWYPQDYFGATWSPVDVEAQQVSREYLTIFGTLAAMFMLFGSSAYLFGRTLKGGEEFEETHVQKEA